MEPNGRAKIAIVTGGRRGLGRNAALSLDGDRWINGQRIEVSGGMKL